MKLRIKNTPFWGEVVGNSGSAESPRVSIRMSYGEVISISREELTDNSIKQVIEDFAWSVFAESGNYKKKAIFFLVVGVIGFIISFILNFI